MDVTLAASVLPWIVGLAAIFFVGKLFQVLTMTTPFAKRVNQLPGPPIIPIFGNAWPLITIPREDILRTLEALIRPFQKEPVIRVWLGFFNPRFAIMNAKAAEQILTSTVHIDKSDDYRFLHAWLGFGLLTSTGERWHRRRKMLTPSFHFTILEDFLHVFTEQSQILVDILHQKAGKGTFDVFPYITHCTLDIICESAMGIHHNAQRSTHSEYVDAVYKMGQRVEHRIRHPWLSSDFIYNIAGYSKQDKHYLNILHGFSKKVISERKLLRNTANKPETEEVFSKKRRLAFLDLLLEATYDGKGLTDEELREEVDTFMFEGHDTTSAALGFVIYFLGQNPSIQKRVQDELNNVLGDENEPITTAKLSQLKYLEAVIKESLRICPSVPIIMRKLKEETTICGWTLPAESNVFIAPILLHHDPDVFPDSETFDPERFMGDNMKDKNPFAYIPFSAGPRNCIGQKFAMMEEKVVLSGILRNFNIKSHQQADAVKLLMDPILHSSTGIIISLEKRVKA